MNFDEADYRWMSMALRLAARGMNSTDPNPRVGCVITRNGKLVGSGWHRTAGKEHAEIHALRQAGDQARGGTAYVTLEPCSHAGRTAPCTGALIAAEISEVVVATTDPNPAVNGGGLGALEAAGIRCRSGLLASQGEDLNAGFFSRMRRGRPWVRVKIAQSIDGGTALADGRSQWITGDAARRDVQRWRARSSAIMTGVGTLLADDPSLNVRLEDVQRQPRRVIADSRWRTPPTARSLSLPGEVIVAGLAEAPIPDQLKDSGATLVSLPADGGRVDLPALLARLAELEVNELHVEAGGVLCGALMDRHLVDEILLYQAPCLLGAGARAPFAIAAPETMEARPALDWVERAVVGNDLRLRLKPQYSED